LVEAAGVGGVAKEQSYQALVVEEKSVTTDIPSVIKFCVEFKYINPFRCLAPPSDLIHIVSLDTAPTSAGEAKTPPNGILPP
jgi:hypothetical protein